MAVVVVGRFLLSSKISNRLKRRRKEASNHGAQLSRASHETSASTCASSLPSSTIPPFFFSFPFYPSIRVIISRHHPRFFLLPKGLAQRSPPAVATWNFIRSQGDLDEIDTVKFYEPCSSPLSFLLLFLDFSRVTFVYRMFVQQIYLIIFHKTELFLNLTLQTTQNL